MRHLIFLLTYIFYAFKENKFYKKHKKIANFKQYFLKWRKYFTITIDKKTLRNKLN